MKKDDVFSNNYSRTPEHILKVKFPFRRTLLFPTTTGFTRTSRRRKTQCSYMPFVTSIPACRSFHLGVLNKYNIFCIGGKAGVRVETNERGVNDAGRNSKHGSLSSSP